MNFQGVKVLITGGAGFIGANLAKYFVKKKAEVTVFDDFSTGSKENLNQLSRKIKILKADIRDFQAVKKAAADQNLIYHMAANASVPVSTSDPKFDFEVNAGGTLNILNAILKLDLNAKLVFASSAAVYGEPETVPILEGDELKPISPYGASKLSGEILCQTFHRVYGLQTLCLRYFNVYGPLQRKYVMFDLLEKLRKENISLEVLGTGNEVRDFIYISDAVNASTMLVDVPSAYGEKFNVGTGGGTSIKELVNHILEKSNLQSKTRVHFTSSSWEGDVKTLVADINKIREHNFRPEVSLETGLTRFIKWHNTLQFES